MNAFLVAFGQRASSPSLPARGAAEATRGTIKYKARWVEVQVVRLESSALRPISVALTHSLVHTDALAHTEVRLVQSSAAP